MGQTLIWSRAMPRRETPASYLIAAVVVWFVSYVGARAWIEMMAPGNRSEVRPWANSHAATTAKAGLTNSDGWIDRPGT